MRELRFLKAVKTTALAVADAALGYAVPVNQEGRRDFIIRHGIGRDAMVFSANEQPRTHQDIFYIGAITWIGSATIAGDYVVYKSTSDSFRLMLERIQQLAALSENWNGRGAPSPNDWAVRRAISIASRLAGSGTEPSRIVAAAGGGITFYFLAASGRPGERFASIDCLNTGERIAMLSDRRAGDPEVWEIEDSSFNEAFQRVQRFLADASARP